MSAGGEDGVSIPARLADSGAAGDFLSRVRKFTEWPPGWDGEDAEPISRATANRAIKAADLMLAVAPEPFVAPAPTGALLLQWDFPDGRSVEVFIDADEHPSACAVVTTGDAIEEVALSGLEQLRDLLENRVAARPART